jgi:CheY-like chemotaxis protein
MDGKGYLILIVDDDEAMSTYVGEILDGLDYEHVSFNDPGKALEFLAENAGKVDLVISDVVMPDMSGFEVAKEAARLKQNIPVILLSAFTDTLPQAATIPNVRAVLEKHLLRTDLRQAVEWALRTAEF